MQCEEVFFDVYLGSRDKIRECFRSASGTVQCMSVTEVFKESNKPKAFRRLLSKSSQKEHIQVQSFCTKDKLELSMGLAATRREEAGGLL